MENFDEERLRRIYNIEGHDCKKIPDWFLERIIIRSKLLTYNEKFVKEWNELKLEYQKTYKSLDVNEWDDFKLKCKNFYEKWHIRFPDGTHNINTLYSRYVLESMHNNKFGVLTVDINLDGSKDRIMQEIYSLITYWKNEYDEAVRIQKNNFPKYIDHDRSDVSVKGNFPSNIDDYNKFIIAYSMNKKGYYHKDIAKALSESFNDEEALGGTFDDNKRRKINHKIKKAQELISNGIPGLPPFPKD